MAESAVSFFLVNLKKLMMEETELLLGVQDQVCSLSNELEWICTFLKYADIKCRRNDLVKIWVNQVREVAYDADDVIDMFVLKIERHRQRNLITKTTRMLSHIITLHNIGKKIEDIKTRMTEISANKGKYMIDDVEEFSGSKSTGRSSAGASSSIESWPMCRRYKIVEKIEVVGFEDYEKMLVSQLTEGMKRRAVISIVGMGGLGKTTIAQKVYNNGDVKDHFDCHVWVRISKNYNSKNALRSIIKRVMNCTSEEIEKLKGDELARKLHKYLKEKTYLIVLDDVWCVKAWDELKVAFPDEMNGSRILLTTRKEDVASYADARKLPYRLRFLSEAESWDLFCRNVFPEDAGSDFSPYLEKIGREIATKCEGLPLALVVLGGLLSSKKKYPSEWQDLLTNITTQLREGKNKISTIFDLSYTDLTYNLKSCFLYCSLFPLDFEIPAEKLIQLWVAEGLLLEKWRSAEEEAEEHLEELVSRSMIQVIKRSSDGRVKTCRVHHILRELSIIESKETHFLHIHGTQDSTFPTKTRRLAIHSQVAEYIPQKYSTSYLRSVLCFTLKKEGLKSSEAVLFFRGLKLITVLDLEGVLISKLPCEIGNMIHLRFLGLRNTFIRKLPSSISNLCYMETLDLRSVLLFVLPNVIRKMQRLRHLYVDQGGKIDHLEFGCFRNLRTLWMIEAGSWIREDLAKSTNMIKLGIFGDLHMHGKALNDAVDKLYKLRSLKLKAKTALPAMYFSRHLHLHKLSLNGQLERLLHPSEFPPSLSKLTLSATELKQDPMPVLGKLPNLRILKLHKRSYVGKKMVCLTGLFSRLEVLELTDLPELELWEVQEGAIQNLVCLFINGCLSLKMLPEELSCIVTISELCVTNMPAEFKQKIQENGDDWYKIRHIPLRTI
ncbi:hypothetical protein AQUCO_03600063v1 [Aquilegia coerulea]|uniref:AAA+ ATPase domain-containing protein n=1 Tax=Aquilegia coerulea TaxID=218851 RepID=A0A2G5CV55_AQUCA|nr:hypothetical protein AQUCO_03600063v1 [Aquilegia coerulea]